jgi:formate dehydrogenase subunit gamma
LVEFREDEARQIIHARLSERGPLLEILHDLQDAFGYLDDRALALAAEALNITRAEVHGVATFYQDFRRQPAGRSHVRICRAEACQSMGAEALVEHAERVLATAIGETRGDGQVTVEQVFCLGNCALSPAVMVDGRLYGRVSAERFDEIVGAVAS